MARVAVNDPVRKLRQAVAGLSTRGRLDAGGVGRTRGRAAGGERAVQRHDDEAEHNRLVQVAREALGGTFTTVWEDGHASTMDDAVTRALDCTHWSATASPLAVAR